MVKRRILDLRSIVCLGLTLLVVVGLSSSGSLTDGGQPFVPGSRVEGYHSDALLILHNLGAGASLRASSAGTGPGIQADSQHSDGVAATTANANYSGVFGHSTVGVGVKGRSDSKAGVLGWTGSQDASGVFGHSTVGVGVTGRSDSKAGVVGWTGDKGESGVYGYSTDGTGVTGFSENSTGVYGRSTDGFGVIARSDYSTALFVDGTSVFKNFASFEGGHGDIAENYHAGESLQAGNVVVISPTGGLELVLARTANSTAVAGVIATEPSLWIAGSISSTDSVPLAIAGRVLCKVDAGYGPIEPGDLLTTSPTPGHAMRATPVSIGDLEFYRPGTILGKALEACEEGQGLIQILVTLQ